MIMRNISILPPRSQRGAVLFVALVFLILLSLLGVTAIGTSILQERMMGGMRNSQLARIGGESALRGAEVLITTQAERSAGALALPPCAGSGATDCAHKRINGAPEALVQTFRTQPGWLATAGAAYATTLTGFSGTSASAALASQPRFVIEDLGKEVGASLVGAMTGTRQPEGACPTCPPPTHLYRITARSQGGTAATMHVIESVFGAAFSGDFQTTP